MSAATEALIAVVTAALPSSSPPASPLSPWSSPLLQIPSLPLPVPSPPLPLPSPPTYTIPTYVEAPLGYRAAMIRARAASPPTHHPSEIPSPPPLLPSTTHRDDIPKVDMPLWKRARFSALASRFEVRESSTAAAARQFAHALTSSSDYGSIDTVDASICASESRSMIIVGERGDTFARWLLLMSMRLLMPVGHRLTLREGARPWRPRLELYRGMSMYYRGRRLEMRTD
ncbi:hypothetical protein Tco_0959950 [Tanacetum coccineum]